jgi:RES domain-containing protein
MPFVWRLTTPRYGRILDGAGNREFGARWNSPGHGLVYTSLNLSLCVLETYVHMALSFRQLPTFEAVRLSVPDDAGTALVSAPQFDKVMASPAPLAACRTIGDEWFFQGENLAFQAPSVIVPEDTNIMLNPLHPRMRDVSIVSMRTFHFDPRLLQANA